jgi:LPXTG-motif cell wall-anchored protein
VPRPTTGRALAGASIAAALAVSVSTGAPALAAETPPPQAGEWQLRSETDVPALTYLAVDPVAQRLFYNTFDPNAAPARIFTVDSVSGAPVRTIDAGRAPAFTNASVNSATHRMYVPVFGSKEVLVVNTLTGERVTSLTGDTWMPFGTAVDEATNTAYAVDGDDNGWNQSGLVYVIDGETNTLVTSVPIDPDGGYPAVSSEHGKLFIPVEGDDSVIVFDTETNTVVGGISGSEPGALAIPTMVVADDDLDRLFVFNANTSGSAGGFATFSVVDSATDEVVTEVIPLPANFVPSDRFGYDEVGKRITVGASYDDGTSLVNPDGPSNVIWTIDALSGSIITTTAAPGAGSFDTLIDPTTDTLYASIVGADGSGTLAAFDWVVATLPAEPPAGGGAGKPAATGPETPIRRLPDTGVDASSAWWAVAALLTGAGVLTLGLRRSRSRTAVTAARR